MGRLASRCLLIVTIVNSLEGAAVRVVSDAERTEGCVAVPLYRSRATVARWLGRPGWHDWESDCAQTRV